MAHSPRGFSRGARAPRRKVFWNEGPGGSTVTSFASSTTSILGAGVTAISVGLTVVRIHGMLSCYLGTTSAGVRGFHCVFGMGIVSNDAFAVGVTAVPNPADDMDWPGWMVHRIFDVQSLTATIADGSNAVSAVGLIEIDNKSMRKLGLNETLFGSLQVVENGTEGLEVFFETRILVKAP